VYKVTEIDTGKYYIGVHRTNNLEDGYMGSGLLIQKLIKERGKENFRKDILFTFDTPDPMWEKEEILVTAAMTTDKENCLNLIKGGMWGHLKATERAAELARTSPEYRAKLRDKFIEVRSDPDYRKRMSESCKKRVFTPEWREKISIANKKRWAEKKGLI
jgi:hypothetical protein